MSRYSWRPGRVVRWSAERRWRAVYGWPAFVALQVAISGAVGSRSQSDAPGSLPAQPEPVPVG